MDEVIKKLTEEFKAQMLGVLQTKEMQDVITSTKAASDTGTFKFIASTPAVDRQGESIDQNGWELDNFLLNPVLLWCHDYSQPPVGVIDSVVKENGNLVISGRFAPTDFAQQIRKLYDLKMINAVSVGFIPKEMVGNVVTKAELLEVSVVLVPANAQALSVRQVKELGINVELFKTKGIELTVKEEEKAAQEGDPCKMPDGSDGVMGMEDGQMVCMLPVQEESKAQLEAKVKDLETELTSLKAGRVLSEKNRTLIKTTIDGLQATMTALQELYDATDAQGGKSAEALQEAETKIKKAQDFPEEAMQNWLLQKQVLGAVVTALSEAGANLNKKIKSQEIKVI